jgi:hypothetical protein
MIIVIMEKINFFMQLLIFAAHHGIIIVMKAFAKKQK